MSISTTEKLRIYRGVLIRLNALLNGEIHEVSALATIACELYQSFRGFDWCGFYRVTSPQLMTVGPFQGGHGCLHITFDRGICGAAACSARTQLVADVNTLDDYITCSTTTESEIAVPVFNTSQQVVAVMNIDSKIAHYFTAVDQEQLEIICGLLHRFYPHQLAF